MTSRYDVTISPFRFGDIELDVEHLRDFERSVDAIFEDAAARGIQTITEEMCPYFGTLWPAARALVEHLTGLSEAMIVGTRMLEVGCGLALPSMVAARRGALVTAIDFHADVAAFLERNLERNQLTGVTYRQVDWREPPADLGVFPLIVASDVLYDPGQSEKMADFIETHLERGGHAVITDPGRFYLQDFVSAMSRRGFVGETDGKVVTDGDGRRSEAFVLRFRR